ncbi:MAG: glycine cleavage system aminomethyltransferase GcvT [Acidimicrobiaceae bacterium]|nr:glycine cleavage system aminomethyltransferase GcvT [Acidimicrobiaceae bacterium]
MAEVTLHTSPLDSVHRGLGARMVAFGGWEMPVSYPVGTLAEHATCRTGAALFDVSHLGSLDFRGPHARDAIQAAFSNDLERIAPGRAQYTHLLDDADGSVVDDIIVWWLAPDHFVVLPNASNSGAVVDALPGCVDIRPERALLALQGPSALTILGSVVPGAATVARFTVAPFQWESTSGLVAGTGYTGEDGVELAVPVEDAADLWRALVSAGAEPAGLGARDTLRLEAGLPLHGHELGSGITPLDAGLGWVVGWEKEAFRGRTALLEQRRSGPGRRLRGLAVEGRRPPREGQAVIHDGKQVAELTSGNFSPTLGHGIAMAFLPLEIGLGDVVILDQRGTEVAATVVAMPFVGG